MDGTSSTATPTATQHYQDDRVVRPREAAHYLGVSRSTLYELIERGLLEAPFATGVRAVGWRYSTLHAYLERRAAEHASKRAAKQSRSD